MPEEEEVFNREASYSLTSHILKELDQEVTKRGGQLLVVAIPSKKEFFRKLNYQPFQRNLARISESLKIPYFDLAPALGKSVLRTYYRMGAHWNKKGHRVVSEALAEHLKGSEYLSR